MVNPSTAPIPLDLRPFGAAIAPDGQRLYFTSPDDTGAVFVVDTTSHSVTAKLACPGARAAVMSPSGDRLYVAA